MIALTEEQLAVVEDRAGPLLVAAGAGSGKTRVMVERIVRAVIDDGVEVGRILAITFTEKAAGELADRVRERFLELERYDAARDAERAWISTIHGFCARLLRAHALAAGVDPEFRVLDETDSAWLRRTAFEDALEELLDAQDGEEALGDLAPFSVAELRDLVVAAHERLRLQGAAEPVLPEPEVADPQAACAQLASAATAFAAELGGAATNTTVEKALKAIGRCVELAGRMPDRDELEAITVAKGNAKAMQTAAAEEYIAAVAAIRQAAIDAEALPALQRIDALLRAFARRYAELKAARSGLDFEDLELRADALLASDASLRERYAERFVHVMVDEFQDTNPVQLRIIERVASGNLFTVGDEFQSIYSFRHADVELFRARRAELAPQGRVRELSTSFRAVPELLAALRVAFAGELFSGDYVPLLPAKGEAEAATEAETETAQLTLEGLGEGPQSPVVSAPRVEILVTEKDRDAGWDAIDLGDTLPRDTVWRLAEARLLAQRIRELVDGGRSPGDIAVLVRATAGMAVIERALAEAGVPTYLIGGRGFWSQRQVADLTAYLAALANPRDDLRLYEALASPLGGASSDTLALLADAARPRSAWDRLVAEEPIPGLGPEEVERLRTFADRLQAHRELTARLPLDGLIERVIADTRYDLAVLQLPGGERRLANVRKLLRLAREFEAQEGRDLRGLVDLVEALAGEELGPDREGEAPVESEDLAAVRIMTIHRAKGLEFPVVCVADMGREPFTGGRDLLRLDRDGRIGLKLPSDGNGGRPAFDWQRIKDDQQAEADEEERRLFYVAMTRAQEHLILSGALPRRRPATREPLAWIARALVGDALERLTPEDPVQVADRARVRCVLNAPATVDIVLTAPAPEAPDPFAKSAQAAAAAPTPLALEAPPPALPVSHLSYSTLERYGRCGYRFYLERVLGLPRVPAPPPPVEEGPRLPALVRGSLAHILLEELDLAAPVDPTDEALDLIAADRDAVLTPEDRDDLRDLVARFVASRLGARLAAADEVKREAGFSFVAGTGEDAVLVNGYVDALARDAEGTLIVDYKTDRLGDETPEEVVARDYRIQQVIYALAALRAGAPAVEVAHCFLERADEPVWARYGAADVPALEAELSASAAGIRDGVFPVSDRPHYELCATCPGRGTLCSWPEEATVRASAELPAPAEAVSPAGDA